MSTEHEEPCGWIRGEPLEVRRKVISGVNAFMVRQSNNLRRLDGDFNPGCIAYKWFYTFDELLDFLRWWMSA